MFAKKRLLKKEKIRKRYKIFIFVFIFFTIGVFILEILYFNFSFGRVVYISPVAKHKQSQISFLENSLEKAGILFTNVNAQADGSFKINLKDGSEVILSSKKDIKAEVSSLQLILSRLTIEGKKLKTLDLRYNRPIISF